MPTVGARRRVYLVYLARRAELRMTMAGHHIGPGELARILEVSRNTIYGVLQGRDSSERTARAIAEFFERPLEDLFLIVDLENPDSLTRSEAGADRRAALAGI